MQCRQLVCGSGRRVHKLRRWPFFDDSWGELGVDLRSLLGRHLSSRDGCVGVHFVCGGHLVGRDGVKHSMRSVFGWAVRVECRRVRLLGLRGRQLLRRKCERLRRVHRGNFLCVVRGIKLYELRTRRELGRGIKRLFRLCGWNLPGRDGRLKLFELRHRNIFCARSERLLELRRWDLPGIHQCVKLCSVCCWNGVKCGWCIGV